MKTVNVQEISNNEFVASAKMMAMWAKAAGFEGADSLASPEAIDRLKSGEFFTAEQDGCRVEQSAKFDSDRKVWVLRTEVEVSEELTLLGLDFLTSPEVLEIVTFVAATAKALKGLMAGVQNAFTRMGERAASLRK